MAKTRLNQTHRDILRGFAEKAVKCPKEQKARDRAYAKASDAVYRCVEKQFPAADMAVLAEYSVTTNEAEFKGGSPEGRFMRFEADAGTACPARPLIRYSGATVSFDAKTVVAIDEYDLAKANLEAARIAKLADYRALISSAKTFEDIVDVWPAAVAVADRVRQQQTSLVVMSAEKIAAIREDNAGADIILSEAA